MQPQISITTQQRDRVAGGWRHYKAGEWGKLKLKVGRVNTAKEKTQATTAATIIKITKTNKKTTCKRDTCERKCRKQQYFDEMWEYEKGKSASSS